MTLAERFYDRVNAEDELLSTIHTILTGTSVENALEPDFKWRVIDVSVDSYDESVEVIMIKGSEPLTRPEVDQILDLGFGQIYESIGDEGRNWTRSYGPNKCSSRKPSDEDHIQIQKLRQKVKELESLLSHKHP